MSTELATRDGYLPAAVLRRERELTTYPDSETCQQVAEMIVGSYPNANPSDPTTYMRALRSLLSGYPANVVAEIASPKTGIVTQCKFLPSMAEIEEFAGPRVREMQRYLERDRSALDQIERRDREPTDEEREYVAERFRELAASLRSRKEEHDERMKERFMQTQCAPGTAIRAHMGLEGPGEEQ